MTRFFDFVDEHVMGVVALVLVVVLAFASGRAYESQQDYMDEYSLHDTQRYYDLLNRMQRFETFVFVHLVEGDSLLAAEMMEALDGGE